MRRDDAACGEGNALEPLALERVYNGGDEFPMRAGEDAHAHGVGLELAGLPRDFGGRLAYPRIGDFEPGVPQKADDDARAPVVAVEPGLGDQHAERSVGHRSARVGGYELEQRAVRFGRIRERDASRKAAARGR